MTQKPTFSPHRQHSKITVSLQIPDDKRDLSPRGCTDGNTKQFKQLACHFAEQDTVDDIVYWSGYLWKQLKTEQLVYEFNVWSREIFRPRPFANERGFHRNPDNAFQNFRTGLRYADWNVGSASLDDVSSMMLYGRSLRNKGLFAPGTVSRFWLFL